MERPSTGSCQMDSPPASEPLLCRDIGFPTSVNACNILSYPGATTAVSEPLSCQWVKPQRAELSLYLHLDRRVMLWHVDI
jgi:hypothetical protein